jgi:hypothetical protein
MVDPAALRLVLQETLSPYADKRRAGESHCSAFARRNYDRNAISSARVAVCRSDA